MTQLPGSSQAKMDLINNGRRLVTIAKVATGVFLLAGILITGSLFADYQQRVSLSAAAAVLDKQLQADHVAAESDMNAAQAASTASDAAEIEAQSELHNILGKTSDGKIYVDEARSAANQNAYANAKHAATQAAADFVAAGQKSSAVYSESLDASTAALFANVNAGRAWSDVMTSGALTLVVTIASFVVTMFLIRSSLKARAQSESDHSSARSASSAQSPQ